MKLFSFISKKLCLTSVGGCILTTKSIGLSVDYFSACLQLYDATLTCNVQYVDKDDIDNYINWIHLVMFQVLNFLYNSFQWAFQLLQYMSHSVHKIAANLSSQLFDAQAYIGF